MAEFPDIYSMSYDQLQRLTQDPSFRDAGWFYRTQALTRLRDLSSREQSRRAVAPMMNPEVAQRESERLGAEAARERERVGQSASRARDIAAGMEPPQYQPYSVDLTRLPPPFAPQAPPPPRRAPPDPEVRQPPQSMVDAMRAFLGQPGAGGGGRAFAAQQGKYEDPEEYKKRVMVELPEERKAQPTYKADQGMALLETGLKILSAQPKLGQGALSAIAGPVAEGVKEYRGEREKQRLSEKEEAKETREDKLRMAGIKRDIENSAFERDKAIKTYGLEVDKLREMQRHNMSSEATAAQSARVAQASLLVQSANVDINRDQLKANLARQPAQIFKDLESSGVIDTVSELQGKRDSGQRLSPEENAQLARATMQIGIMTGNYAGLLRSDSAQDRLMAQNAANLLKQAKEMAAQGNPERAAELERRAMRMMMQSMGISSEAPSPSQSLIIPR